MTDHPDTFREGAGAFRNTRDWAKEKRDEFIAAANGKMLDTEYSDLVSSTQSFVSLSSNDHIYLESETSADELALDMDTFASSSHRTPVGARMYPTPKGSSDRPAKKKAVRANKRSGVGSGG